MAGRDNTGTDQRQISQQPSSSGSGGVVGPISAAVGDLGFGESASDGRQTTETYRQYTFSGPQIERGMNPLWLVALAALAYIIHRRRK